MCKITMAIKEFSFMMETASDYASGKFAVSRISVTTSYSKSSQRVARMTEGD